MSSENKIRVGLVGTGGISRSHAHACQSLDRVELCSVTDISEQALTAFCENFEVENRYLDLDQMLEKEDLDIAIICTWGVLHREVSNQIAQSQKVKAILCEKPFAQDAAEAEDMVKVAVENGVMLAEAFKFRHHPMHLKAKAMTDAGDLGEVTTIRSTFCMSGGDASNRKPKSNWRFDRARGGGAIFDLGCYCIHHARFIFGADPSRVYATVQMGMDVDDAVYALLTFPNDATAQLSFGWRSGVAHYAEICGSEGMLRLEPVWNNENQVATMTHHRPGSKTEKLEFGPVHQFVNQLDHLCDCLESGQPHRISPENSINQMKVIDACYESILTGNVVDLGETQG
jgi:predicted dehydrogenase